MDVCTLWGIQPEALNEMKAWFKQQKHLPQDTTDEYFAMMIHSCYSDLQRAKKTIEVYFQVKTAAPEMFAERSLNQKNLQQAMRISTITSLPSRTEDGYLVIWGRLDDPSTTYFVAEDIYKFTFMVMDILIKENPGCPGMIFVHDTNNCTFGHIFKVSIQLLKKYFRYIQDGCPVRLKAIHVLNAGAVMTTIMNLCKPFIYKEYAQMVHMYTVRDFENFLSTSKIMKENLPVDYGGYGPSLTALAGETVKSIKKNADWFEFDEKLRIKK